MAQAKQASQSLKNTTSVEIPHSWQIASNVNGQSPFIVPPPGPNPLFSVPPPTVVHMNRSMKPGTMGPVPSFHAQIQHSLETGNQAVQLQNQPNEAGIISTNITSVKQLELTPQQQDALRVLIQDSCEMVSQNSITTIEPVYPRHFKCTDCKDPITKNGWLAHLRANSIVSFSGNLKGPHWVVWWNRFYEVIHKYDTKIIPELTKLDALMMVLSGSAKMMVEGYYVSEDPSRYRKAVAALQARYGDTLQARMSVEKAMQKLVPESKTAEAYLDFFAKVNSYKNQLITYGEDQEVAVITAYKKLQNFAPQAAVREFHTELTQKTHVVNGVYRKISTEQKYDLLLCWLETKIQSYCIHSLSELDTSQVPDICTNRNNKFEAQRTPHENQPSPAEARVNFYSQENQKVISDRRKRFSYPCYSRCNSKQSKRLQHGATLRQMSDTCIYHANSTHTFRECPMTLPERIQWLKDHNRCNNCSLEGHKKNRCPSKDTCRNCKLHGVKARHHTTICTLEPHPHL